MTGLVETLVFAFLGLCTLSIWFWLGFCAGKGRAQSDIDQLKLKCAQLQEWIDGVDKGPMDFMSGGGHLYVLMGSGEIYRRVCDEKGNFDGEWEQVTGPWRTTGAK